MVSAMTGYTFYSKPQYFARLIERLGQLGPGDRFMTANMVTLPEAPEIAAILEAMAAASRRGAIVSFITDAKNFLISYDDRIPGPLLLHHRLPRQGMAGEFQRLQDSLEELEAAGVRVVVLNRPRRILTVPVAGRCHIKFAVINDEYYVGGCNFDRSSHIDLMVAATDAPVAKYLYELGERMLQTASSMTAIGGDDLARDIAPDTTLYLDAGAKHRSVILDQALAFIDDAREHITITCQFFPGLVTAKHLKAAHRRGVKVEIFYNNPSMHRPQTYLGFKGAEVLERLRMPSSFFTHARRGPGYIHAKLIATEQGAMIGSHNYVIQGVNFGTAEIALKVLSPEFSRRAVAALKRQL
jgi:phosphatidylserine/phosphatidylglycerophosphate/cardiolipin synthase-like enzyme